MERRSEGHVPPLYDRAFEHDACGVGFVAKVSGQQDHDVLVKALQAVANLTHRGAVDADAKTGDGSGVLTQLPRKLLAREAERRGFRVERPSDLALGMIFLPRQDLVARDLSTAYVDHALRAQGLIVVGWREVPIDHGALGEKALDTRPKIRQVIVARPSGLADDAFERALLAARRAAERRTAEQGIEDFYVPSLSSRTVVYKGLMLAPQLPTFYADLRDPDYETSLALFHQRYSTNTLPNWLLAQPFRMLAHNGEINTLQGNRAWMRAREPELQSGVWGEALAGLRPIIWEGGSDSASLDNVLELLERSGRDVLHAMMMLVPQAWENLEDMDPRLREFYRYHACLTEPWDGPAALSFTDGVVAGAVLDRNGLRPSRYKIDEDGLVVAASEVGVFDMDDARVVEKGRLGPGQMLAVDTARGRILTNEELKREVAERRPYGEWVRKGIVGLATRGQGSGVRGQGAEGNGRTTATNGQVAPAAPGSPLVARQLSFGYTAEEVKFVVGPMGAEGKDPVWSMGDDTPMAALSRVPRLFYTFFKQRFAQVTNPPIDPLREALVMSLRTLLGPRPTLLEEGPEHAQLLELRSPILSRDQMAALAALAEPPFVVRRLATTFAAVDGPAGLRAGLDRVCAAAVAAVDGGATLLVLSDRDVDAEHAAIPSLMAVGVVHHHLIRVGRRMRVDLVVESGDAWDVHHFATLIGYGAAAVHPWLALETVANAVDEGYHSRIELGQRRREDVSALEAERRDQGPARAREAEVHFQHAAENGLLKIMSKMGISTISSYRGAQIFEILGLAHEVVSRCFQGTPSRIGGLGFQEIAEDLLERHRAAFGAVESRESRVESQTNGATELSDLDSRLSTAPKLPDYGFIRYRREGEYHAYNPLVVRALHKATIGGDFDDYKQYSSLVQGRVPMTLRDLIELRPGTPVPLREVESVELIRRRFISTAMSLGALSPEAHRTLAVAMNRIGARSNSGEGGEDPANYLPDANGDVGHNRIKQVASARFGVTAEYLAMADELEIKMAQGSKPGEGGQLPGIKVNEIIARLRHAVPGISLISPPPHHDIYSIEDLAQLIYDLKQANPRARVGVKLVAEAGVGTIAAGVCKAYADYVLISGHDGGTGASPLSSIKNAGCPWELGLAETQQVLVMNDLRGRIRVRTDGGLKTGRDVVLAAMLGAEEFGFGTAAVVAIGCDMARACHLNTCPTGIATQDPKYRAKFEGTAEMAIHYFTHLAMEVREILASLGFRRLDEVIGRPELLVARPLPGPEATNGARTGTGRPWTLDLSAILAPADPSGSRPRIHVVDRNVRPNDWSLDPQIIRDAQEALEGGKRVRRTYSIQNAHRAVGVRLAGEIARRYGSAGLPEDTIEVRFRGSAGQSFGAWATNGMRLILEGEANDYLGKGLCGGEIVLMPPAEVRFKPHENVIVGNTVLYGATSGRLFVNGRAGERFAVRNSGATAVVEGLGDHGCEYMTGGVVVVLGEVGRNFAAGMSNGTVFVLDPDGLLPSRYNPEMVSLERTMSLEDLELLYSLVRAHFEKTGSPRAQEILDTWDYYRTQFWKVVPYPPDRVAAAVEPAEAFQQQVPEAQPAERA